MEGPRLSTRSVGFATATGQYIDARKGVAIAMISRVGRDVVWNLIMNASHQYSMLCEAYSCTEMEYELERAWKVGPLVFRAMRTAVNLDAAIDNSSVLLGFPSGQSGTSIADTLADVIEGSLDHISRYPSLV